MSEQFPPPGANEPPTGPEPTGPPPDGANRSRPERADRYAPGPYPTQQNYVPSPRAAHKPGAIPLRPLALGDMYDAAFKIIRFNPKATVGSAVLVAAVAMAIPVVITAALGAMWDLSLPQVASTPGVAPSDTDLAALIGVFGALGLGGVLQSIGLILVGGMIAHVVAAAAIGRKLSLGDAWAATRGKRWRLVGLTAFLGLATTLIIVLYVLSWLAIGFSSDSWQLPLGYGLVSVPLFIAFMLWFWVRVYYLPVPALMLEDKGVFAAMGRGYGLTRRAFWRTFGIALLTYIVAQVAGSMLSMPVSLLSQGVLIGGISGELGVYLMVVGTALASVITAAFVSPFTTSVATLQYLDLRMRTEAYDVELMNQAGITQS